MRTLTLLLCILLFPLLHAQHPESVSMEQVIRTAETRNPEIINDTVRKNVVFKITKTWYNWLYSLNTAGTLKEYHDLLPDLERIARLRYESGDIDYFQYAGSSNILAEITTNMTIFENKTRQYMNTIRLLSCIESDILPQNSRIDLYEINKSLRTEYAPFTDSLSQYRQSTQDLEIENMQTELDNLFIRLRYYRSYALDYAEGMRATAIARLKSEDIEYLEYAGYIEKSLKIMLEYLDVLNQYNQCAIQLEEYAY